ncbi:unnamed protein product [Lactuca virosa]|uniref:PB1-like domain-containing protein n=1 Tax=Lactuca virosa TaxID=75947 RepID=A0AAU9MU73_9ASTR|nr:unnamed protein product [Lactuca virosa]
MLTVDVYHGGNFVPKPLVYFNPLKKSVTGVDLKNMGFKEFILQLRKLTKERCTDVYYCLQNRSVVDGLGELRDDNDYVRFLDAGYANDFKINVYIDEYQELAWSGLTKKKLVTTRNSDTL